ncbi:MAG TPA: DinB family protein [Candidatus Acidoferrales bacterium]|nr:DinB family protein [Candidatus Acidoferrales bacterium]
MVGVTTRPQERQKKLELFARGPELLSEGLRRCPRKMWLYRTAHDRWSIHEIILHLADSETEAYVLCRQFIVEPGSVVTTHDSFKWVSTLGYFHQSTTEALGLIVRLRRMTHHILRHIPEPVWAHTAQYPRKGIITLEEWLDVQTQHIARHVEQICQNYAEWPKRTGRTSHASRQCLRALSYGSSA